jgi:hypothetical protein
VIRREFITLLGGAAATFEGRNLEMIQPIMDDFFPRLQR